MKYVVAGASAAGVNAVKELRRQQPEAEIVLISKDEKVYSRCILHHYLSGARTVEELNFAEADLEERYGIQWIKGKACSRLYPEEKKVVLEDGTEVRYDKFLAATGASSFLPPVPGLREADNVIGFRNLEDIEELKKLSEKARNIVIMGAGLVGLDALSGLLHLGKKAAVVEMADRLLSRQLDHKAASAYQKAFEARGMEFIFNTGVKEVLMNDQKEVQELKLTDDRVIPCDLLVVTAGVAPNTGFLNDTGANLERGGLVIDAYGRTSLQGVYGAGDITGKSPIWPAAVKQGIVAAANMTGSSMQMTDFFASKSTMNFEGIPSMSLGMCEAPDDTYTVETEAEGDVYKKIIHKDGKIYGAVLQGDLSYGGILTQLIANHIDVSKVKKPLFKIDYADFFHIKDNFEFYYEEGDKEC